MPLQVRVIYVAVVLGAALSCGRPQSAGPTPVVRALTVACAPAGGQYQCAATAQFTDASTRDVTFQSTWVSLDPTVATVSATGLVAPLRDGTVVLTAAYDGASGRVTLTIDIARPAPPSLPPSTCPASQSVFGEIRERRTEFANPLAGARVDIVSGVNAGRSTTTDSAGRYRLDQLAAGQLTVRATTSGHVDEEAAIALCGDWQLDFRLTVMNARFEGTVFDATSGSLVPLEGATVQIVSGSPAGRMVTSNASGAYSFTGVYGTFTARASKAGYTTEERSVTVSDPIVYWNFGLRRQ